MAAQFILKRRAFVERKLLAFAGYRDLWGPWVSVGAFPSEGEARDAITPGLYDWAVFHRGKRLS